MATNVEAMAAKMKAKGVPLGSAYRAWAAAQPGGGGAAAPSAGAQAAALRNPTPVTSSTPTNPMQQDAYNRAGAYEAGLASGTNEETERELTRARDVVSVGMKREGEAAMSRGADPTLFRSRALASGARDISNLQGRLADVSLGRRAQAIGLVTGAAGSAASEQRMMHLGQQAQSLADQRLLLDQASEQARQYEQPYENLMGMMSAAGGLVGSGVMDPATSTGGIPPLPPSSPPNYYDSTAGSGGSLPRGGIYTGNARGGR